MYYKSQSGDTNTPKLKSKRGFASMTPEKRKEIAGKGGKAAHEKGKAFKFTSDTAREAGRIGGKSVSEDREHMAEIGRRGGEASSLAKGHNVVRYSHEKNQFFL
jgi:general stress protein YciG